MSNHRCEYCRYSGTVQVASSDGWVTRENHSRFCPKYPEFVKEKGERLKLYHQGWDDGRRGLEEKSEDEIYLMGWGNGNCALEEYENGHDPVWME